MPLTLNYPDSKNDANHHRRDDEAEWRPVPWFTPLTQVLAAVGASIILTFGDMASVPMALQPWVSLFVHHSPLMTISPMRHLTDIYTPISGALITLRGAPLN